MDALLPFLVVTAIFVAIQLIMRAQRVKVEDAKALVKDGARLLDVRSKAEFGREHLPNAMNIPVEDLAARVGELGEDKTRPVVVYCASGMRSRVAASMLKTRGFTAVHDLGPMSRW